MQFIVNHPWWTLIICYALRILFSLVTMKLGEGFKDTDNKRGITGGSIARKVLDANGLVKVQIQVEDKGDKVEIGENLVKIPKSIYESKSIIDIGKVLKECGGFITVGAGIDRLGFGKLMKTLMSILVVGALVCSIQYIFILLGAVLRKNMLVVIGVIIFILSCLVGIAMCAVSVQLSGSAIRTVRKLRLLDNDDIAKVKKAIMLGKC